jgi:ribosomal protein L3 glutamine methyltransferase
MPAEVPEQKRQRTVRDWLRFAVNRFGEAGLSFGHGTTNAYDEAAYLILHTLKLPLDRLDPFLDTALTAEENQAVSRVLRLRVEQRVPAAYLTNEAWLGDFRFYVDERVIVPRSYIAELLRDGLSPWVKDPDSVGAALDLCTGSGCLAILLAQTFPNARVDATELSPDASRSREKCHGLRPR